MKTLDARTGELDPGKSMREGVIVDEVGVMEDERPTRPGKALTAQFVASLTTHPPTGNSKKLRPLSERESGSIARLQAEFLHSSLPLFFAESDPVHTLGVTSAVAGEGKTLAALLVSHALATSSSRPVLLIECDWQRPTLGRDLSMPTAPGLSEWLSGTADRDEIRRTFMPNLTIITAGLGGADAMTALAEYHRPEFRERLADPDEIVILDLPSVLGSYFGPIAARLADSLMLVVRAGSTPASFVAQACEALKQMRVDGIILNQVQTRVPRWLQNLI
jgi:protein-tyrosine kinase